MGGRSICNGDDYGLIIYRLGSASLATAAAATRRHSQETTCRKRSGDCAPSTSFHLHGHPQDPKRDEGKLKRFYSSIGAARTAILSSPGGLEFHCLDGQV